MSRPNDDMVAAYRKMLAEVQELKRIVRDLTERAERERFLANGYLQVPQGKATK